jgi:hypothetical protein
VLFFVERLPPRLRGVVEASSALLVLVTAGFLAVYALQLAVLTTGQTTGSGLPLEWSFYPMGAACACMTVFGLERLLRHPALDLLAALVIVGAVAAAWFAADSTAPDAVPPGLMMGLAFIVCLVGGEPIGFVLALSALVYVWTEGSLPGVVFAQQVARGSTTSSCWRSRSSSWSAT